MEVQRLARLPGVAQAAAAARDASDIVLRQPSLRRQASRLAPEVARLGARASAELEGGDPDEASDPVLLGAVRATLAVPELATVWTRAPLQALARLHLLAAADLSAPEALGRPVDAQAAGRLTSLVRELSPLDRPSVPSVVVAAVVHAEVAEAFSPVGGVVGRAAERLVLTASGVDPAGLLLVEVGHLAEQEGYEQERRAFLRGGQVGTARWVERCARAYTRAAEETARLGA